MGHLGHTPLRNPGGLSGSVLTLPWVSPQWSVRQDSGRQPKMGNLSSRASTRKKDLSYKASAHFPCVLLMRTSSCALVPLQGRREGDSVAFQPLEQQVALLAGTAG